MVHRAARQVTVVPAEVARTLQHVCSTAFHALPIMYHAPLLAAPPLRQVTDRHLQRRWALRPPLDGACLEPSLLASSRCCPALGDARLHISPVGSPLLRQQEMVANACMPIEPYL